MDRTYWAQTNRKKLGPFKTEQEAIDTFFKRYPKSRECMTGYGSEGAWFDMRWTRNEKRDA